ncbi:hypothetical protein E4J89_03415 [Arthrobacter sp. CAU 1506]|uniref:hypothetical protein n=1 Tax=Arthrobacter sp. CAU 1506 TaxID=2560052 RepID=UPI0010AC91D6|nr:hypothetical protein [Arthrobacter sp. CAU 1506]TJY71322.1 hypothetical protein E4J89_03415 [Arthrobacter sp. CAU 1506]
MVPLVLLVLVAAAVGFTVWAVDSRRSAYGVLLPPGIAVASAVLLWFILTAAGLASEPGVHYLSWLLPMAVAVPAAWTGAWLIGRRRVQRDTERLTALLG